MPTKKIAKKVTTKATKPRAKKAKLQVGGRVSLKNNVLDSRDGRVVLTADTQGVLIAAGVGLADTFLLVQFDKKFKGGHNGTVQPVGKQGYCYWCDSSNLKAI